MLSTGSKTEDLSPVEEKPSKIAPTPAGIATENKAEVGGVPANKQEEEEESDNDDIL